MADSRRWWSFGSRSADSGAITATNIPHRSSMVSAASPVQHPASPAAISMHTQQWQLRVLDLADLVPEPAGAGSLVRNSVDRVSFVVESKSSVSDRVFVQEYVDKIDFGRAALLIWITGEVYITMPDSGEPQVLSIREFKPARRAGEKNQILVGSSWQDLDDPWFRVWKPSLSNRLHATSPHKAALDLLEAMYVHQLADSSVATSRLAGAGILVWPTNLRSMPLRDDGSPEPGSQQEMIQQFHEAAWSSIKNRDGKDAHIPFVVFVDPDSPNYEPKLLHIERDDHADQYQTRFGTYRERYASAVDLPVESVTGMGQSNHWSAWSVNEEKWKSYLAPLVDLLRSAVEMNIVKPHLGPSATLMADPSALLVKPDQTSTILRLMQLGKVDTSYALEQLGFDPSKATEPPPTQRYATQQMEGIPADMQGGSRGGGQPPQ